MRWIAVGKLEIAAGQDGGNYKSARFNAIRNDAVPRAVKLLDAMDPDGMCACAFDFCPHFGEQGSQVRNLGFASTVFHDGLALGQSSGHHQVFSAGDGDLVKNNMTAVQSLRARFNVAMFLLDSSAKAFQAFDMEIDGAGANGATAGLRNAAAPHTPDHPPQHQVGGTHRFYHLLTALTL